METEMFLKSGKEMIGQWIQESNIPEENRLDVWVKPEDFKNVITSLVKNHWGYIMTITGMDIPPILDQENNILQEGLIEALYHFANEAAIITIRVKVPYSNPKIESICDLIPSATIYEREIIELFGFEIVNTPNTEKLVLPDSWPDGVYPLRKSFNGLQDLANKYKEQPDD